MDLAPKCLIFNALKDAYIAACQAHFKPTGVLPEELFFAIPQYNTWIELMYNQNQQDVLIYAKCIMENDFPAGVLMIDDNWQKYYGNFEFKPDKFPAHKTNSNMRIFNEQSFPQLGQCSVCLVEKACLYSHSPVV